MVVNYTRLNSCLIRDQAQVFPTGKEMRQQLGKKCKVWATIDALAAYYHINVNKRDQDQTNFMLPKGMYFFKKTVMGNMLCSESWLRASGEVIIGLEGMYKLMDDLLLGGEDNKQLAERLEKLLATCKDAGMTLSSNKVQLGEKVSFAGYIIDG